MFGCDGTCIMLIRAPAIFDVSIIFRRSHAQFCLFCLQIIGYMHSFGTFMQPTYAVNVYSTLDVMIPTIWRSRRSTSSPQIGISPCKCMPCASCASLERSSAVLTELIHWGSRHDSS